MSATHCISYIPNAFTSDFLDQCHTYCRTQIDYIAEGDHDLPRHQKWLQEDGGYFDPLWNTRHPRWTASLYEDDLSAIQSHLDVVSKQHLAKISFSAPTDFNSCLINLYRNGGDSIKRHADTASPFGRMPTVAILSLGETRTMHFYRRDTTVTNPRSLKTRDDHFSIHLEHGSLLIMAGTTQIDYLHEIPKEPHVEGSRYSMTFRHYTRGVK